MEQSVMENQKISRLIFKFSIPCVISMIVNALYNIVDQIFIGNGVGYIGNAATAVAFPLFVMSEAIALLLGDGTAAFYSIKLGERNRKDGAKAVGNCIVILIIVGIVFTVFSYIFLENLLCFFGATDNNISYALDYMRIILMAMPLSIVAIGLSSIIRADGSPEYGMIALLCGTILNFILDPVFIFILHMGVKGAAIATAIAQIISFIISINYFRRLKNVKLNKDCFRIDLKILKSIMLFGLSTFITNVAVTFIVIVSNNMLSKYGQESIYGSDIPLSAMGIVMKVNDILIGIVLGIAVGGQPIIGYNYGAKNYKRVKETYFILVKASTVVSIIAFILFHFCPQLIISLFGDNNELYNDFGVKAFRIFLMLCVFIGFELTTIIFFQSIGNPQKSILLTLCKQTIFILPLMIILPKFYGIEGVLYAGPITEIISATLCMISIRKQINNLSI